jgi:hypothetical protein
MVLKSGSLLTRECNVVHLHALQIVTELFQVCEWGHCRLGKLNSCSEKRQDYGTYLITQSLHFLPCSNSTMKGNNGTKRTPRYCWPEHPPCFTVETRYSRLYAFFVVLQT